LRGGFLDFRIRDPNGIACRRCRWQRKAARNLRSGRKTGAKRKREAFFGMQQEIGGDFYLKLQFSKKSA
jgi:hypothetical protein